MRAQPQLQLSTRVQRKDARLAVYVVIPGRYVQPWGLSGTAVIEGTANGFSFGRRTIKAWGKGSPDWFVEFTASFCRTASLDVGDAVALEIRLADTSTPSQLQSILSRSQGLTAAWLALSERERRDAGEHIRSAKTQAARDRRAASIAEKLRGKEQP